MHFQLGNLLHFITYLTKRRKQVYLVEDCMFTYNFCVLQTADVVLAVRSHMKSGSWAREAAKEAAVPVYAIKSSTSVILVRALETLVGLQPASQSPLGLPPISEPTGVQYQNHVVSRVSNPCLASLGFSLSNPLECQ